jgi:peptide-methionine (S)-S-oxide reductase
MTKILSAARGAALALAFGLALAGAASAETRTAIFASGCFWCTQADFLKVPGVTAVVSGYTGGMVVKPTYQQVTTGKTGHREAAQVTYDPSQVSYQQLLDHYWHNVDPFDSVGQFCDKGSSYLSAIFYGNEEEKALAEASKKKVEEKFKRPVVTAILPGVPFYAAEDYHQNYHVTHATQYKFYRWNCGRDQRLEELWGKKSS